MVRLKNRSLVSYLSSMIVLFVAMSLACSAAVTNKKELKIKADRMDYDQVRKEVRLVGNVRFDSEDTVLTAAFACYRTDTQSGDFRGSVSLKQPGSNIVGERMHVDFPSAQATMQGSVRLVTDRVGGQGLRVPATLSCAQLTYHWLDGVGEAKGAVRVRQGERRAFADNAVYRRDAGIINLSGNARFEQGHEDWLACDTVAINIVTQTLVANGQVMGRFMVEQNGDLGRQTGSTNQVKGQSLPLPSAIEPELPVQLVETLSPAGLPELEK